MDKTSIGFIADILYIKGFLCWEEYEAIQEAVTPQDIHHIVDRMLRGDFNVYKRGEGYVSTHA